MAPSHRISTLACSLLFLSGSTLAAAERQVLYSSSSKSCMPNSTFTAEVFDFSLTPGNNSLSLTIQGENTFSGQVTLGISLISAGTTAFQQTLDPCSNGAVVASLCPSSPGPIMLSSVANIPDRSLDGIPDALYTTSDLDAQFRFTMNSTRSGERIACVEVELANGESEVTDAATSSRGGAASTTTSSGGSGEPTATDEAGGDAAESSGTPEADGNGAPRAGAACLGLGFVVSAASAWLLL